MDSVEKITQRLLSQLPPSVAASCLRKASDAGVSTGLAKILTMTKAVDAWLHQTAEILHDLKAEHAATTRYIEKNSKEIEAQQANIRRSLDAIEGVDGLAARNAPRPPQPIPLARGDDIGGSDTVTRRKR